MDAHSKWPEVIQMTSTSAEQPTVIALRQLFGSYRLPLQLVSDNGPQFTSAISEGEWHEAHLTFAISSLF